MTNLPETLADLSATVIAALIARREISPVEAVTASLERIAATCDLNAFMAVCAERALSEARDAEAVIMRGEAAGPLCGVPFSVKDLIDTEGVATTYGSALYADNVPSQDAVSVARARAAGAILIGKTTTPEFGHKSFTEGPFFGRTLNPHNPAHTCGGSSGGAAVAVQVGAGPLALGTDGGGSVRIPAACCGIVGFKATLGVVPHLQVGDLFAATSYVGPMARSVADARLLFDAIKGPHRMDPFGQCRAEPDRSRSSKPKRIGLLINCGIRLDTEVRAAVEAAARHAEALGYELKPIEIDFTAQEEHILTLLRVGFSTRLGETLKLQPELIDPTLAVGIRQGAGILATDLARTAAARSRLFLAVQEIFDGVDLIMSPTVTSPALPVGLDPLGDIQIDGENAGTIRGAWYPYTFPFNLTGHPAISIPCGYSRSGLPIGLQLVGRWHEDSGVLDIAQALEAELNIPPRAGACV